jgi:transcriptional regulator with XRE-family HTH domain
MAAIRTKTVGETLDQLQSDLGLSAEEFASALGVAVPTLNSWQRGSSIPDNEARTRLDQLIALHGHLFETLKPDAVPCWLREHPRYLGGATPAETIVRGDFDRIDALLTIIDYGMFA